MITSLGRLGRCISRWFDTGRAVERFSRRRLGVEALECRNLPSVNLPGLAAYYSFDGDSLDATTNTTGAFVGAGGLTAITTKLGTGAAGIGNTAADGFDISGFDFGNGDFTITFWARQTTAGPLGHIAGGFPFGNSTAGTGFRAETDVNGNWQFLLSDGVNSITTGSIIDPFNAGGLASGNYSFNALTINRSTDVLTAYTGRSGAGLGAPVEKTASIAAITGSLASGPLALSTNQKLDFDEVTIWSRALTSAEIASLYGGGAGDVPVVAALLDAAGTATNDVLLTPVVGQEFTVTVGSIASALLAVESDFAATIAWGDGTTSAGVIKTNASGDGFIVTGTHTYATESTFLVSYTAAHAGTGLTDTADSGAAVVFTAKQLDGLKEFDFAFLPPGGGQTTAKTTNLKATLDIPVDTPTPATLSVAEFATSPVPGKIIKEAFPDETTATLSLYDVRVTGAVAGSTLTAVFHYDGVGTREPVLTFFDTTTQTFQPVQGSLIKLNSFIVDLKNEIITVIFDATSVPVITAMHGTVFAIAVPAPPGSTSSTTISDPSVSIAATKSTAKIGTTDSNTSSGGTVVTFRTSSQLSVNVNAVQDSSRLSNSSAFYDEKKDNAANLEGVVDPETREMIRRELQKLFEGLKHWLQTMTLPLLGSDAPRPQAMDPLFEVREEELLIEPIQELNEPLSVSVLDNCFARGTEVAAEPVQRNWMLGAGVALGVLGGFVGVSERGKRRRNLAMCSQ